MLSVATAGHDQNRVTHLCKHVTVILVCTEQSKRRGRKRNSQEDAVPHSKINTETKAGLLSCRERHREGTARPKAANVGTAINWEFYDCRFSLSMTRDSK